MTEESVVILDVGHGNCAVVRGRETAIVIDGGRGADLLEYLSTAGVTRIEVVLVTHADSDHLKGLVGLVASRAFEIGAVYVNTDSQKDTAAWRGLVYELDDQAREGELAFHVALQEGMEFGLPDSEFSVSVVAPRSYLIALGPGAGDPDGAPISTNTISAVVKVARGGDPLALLASDLDAVGLKHLLATAADIKAPVLVFPHHGGKTSEVATEEANAAFAVELASAVLPSAVVFSIGRGLYATPRPEIVAAIRHTIPTVRIACTQLSQHCADDVPEENSQHLLALHARGKGTKACCAGSIQLFPAEGELLHPVTADHMSFIELAAPTALCRRSPTGQNPATPSERVDSGVSRRCDPPTRSAR